MKFNWKLLGILVLYLYAVGKPGVQFGLLKDGQAR